MGRPVGSKNKPKEHVTKLLAISKPKRKYQRKQKRAFINSDYVVTSDVPLPHNLQLPFADMNVGDSFTFPRNRKSATSAAASVYKRKHKGWNYTMRDNRLWRTS